MMANLRTMWTVVAATLMLGCQPTVVTPFLDGVTPNWGFNGEETDVQVLGQNLFAGMDASGGAIDGYDRDFVVELIGSERRPLSGVQQITTGRIAAEVPAGLSPGWYELAVTTPGGQIARLGDAFEVTNTKADSLRVTAERTTLGVNDVSIIQISLRAPDGEIVSESVPVRVTVAGTAQESGSLTFTLDGLVDGAEVVEGAEASGRLGVTGEAFFGISSSVPDTVWVTIEATIRDRVVVAATQLVNFVAGDVAGLVIEASPPSEGLVAGGDIQVQLRLVDETGSTVSGTTATVAIRETCFGGQFQTTHTFVDDATISARPTMSCPANTLHAFGVVEGVGVEGETESFEVVAGPLSALTVAASPEVVVAGVEDLTVFVQGVDEYLNPVDSELGEIEIYADGDRLEMDSGSGTYSCSPLAPGQQSCSVRLFEAAEDRSLEARSSLGPNGIANPIQVRPGPLDAVHVELSRDDAIAGMPLDIDLMVFDAFHNPILLASAELEGLVFFDAHGPISCTYLGTDYVDRTFAYDCTLTVAGDGNQIFVVSSDTGASGESTDFSVFPGALDMVVVTVDEAIRDEGIFAGETFEVAFEGFDAYDNRVTGTHDFGLENVAGEINPSELTLGDGTALETVQLVRANLGDSIWVTDGLDLLGVSAPIQISPGPLFNFEISLNEPWATVSWPTDVLVRPVDAYGNNMDSGPISLEISSTGGLGPPVTHTIEGEVSIPYTFDTAGIGDELQVVGEGRMGSFGPVDVGLFCPEVDGSLELGGTEDSLICMSEGGETSVEVSWALPGYIHGSVYIDGEELYRGSETDTMVELYGAGSGSISAFLLTEDACGITMERDYWVGEAGDPVGPVEMTASSSILVTGLSGGLSEAEVTVSAETCTGDGASGERLNIRTRGGNLDSVGDGVLEATGEGLEVELDDGGDSLVSLSVEDFGHAGTLDVIAGTANGSAFGAHAIEVAGDSTPPQVWSCSPWGRTMVSTRELVVEFSEPMLVDFEAAVADGWVSLVAVTGGLVEIDSIELDDFGDTLTVHLSDSIDTGSAAWSLVISDEFRDEAGNRLDGDNDGFAGGDWSRMFGDVTDTAPNVTSCLPTTGWFSPDGDDGSGRHADAVHLALIASDEAEWWRIDVIGEKGEWLWTHTVSSGRSMEGYLSWLGRDASGMVVPNGVYTMHLSALDMHENTGETCVVAVSVANPIGIPADF